MFGQQPDSIIIAVIILAFLSVITMVLGVVLAIYVGKSERSIAVGIGFSAGIMLLISFFSTWGSLISASAPRAAHFSAD